MPAVPDETASRAALRALLLAMADDDLVVGHRHSEWTGLAPDIESDVALSSIAQDEIGHARLLYEQVAGLDGTSADRLAYGRAPHEFCNAVLLERENGDWSFTIVRAWLYDHADAVRLSALAASPLGSLAAVASTLQREEKYHVLFSETWLERLARATDESRRRMQAALETAWSEALAVLGPTPDVDVLTRAGLLITGPAEQQARWAADVARRLTAFGLCPPAGVPAAGGGRAAAHSPALAALLDEMTSVWRTDPEATW
ncbi:MAG: 1,2-phenylacetyl-CoA epoxidase subunit PaaC [Armatimonadota bacterium]|nr:1,2-phenylacetyl-CoA epoxidase subunit PaaC [Armatimonadota bacterium]